MYCREGTVFASMKLNKICLLRVYQEKTIHNILNCFPFYFVFLLTTETQINSCHLQKCVIFRKLRLTWCTLIHERRINLPRVVIAALGYLCGAKLSTCRFVYFRIDNSSKVAESLLARYDTDVIRCRKRCATVFVARAALAKYKI